MLQKPIRRLVAFGAVGLLSLVVGAQELLPPSPCFDGSCAEHVSVSSPEEARSGNPLGIKWNPGVYQILDLPRALDDVVLERYLNGHQGCTADYPWFTGFKVRIHWQEYERAPRDYSAGDEIVQRLLDKLATHCGNRRLILHTDFHANHFSHAGHPNNPSLPRLCAPADLREFVVERTAEQADNRTPRCMAPVWNNDTPVPARHNALVDHIARTWNSHPRFEGYFPKGEGSIGGDIEGNDPTYNRLRYEQYMFDLALRYREQAPNTWFALGTNFHAGVGIDGPQNLVDNWLPWIEANGVGIGVHWPDTHTVRQFPATSAHRHHRDEWANQIAMVGEWQRPGTTFRRFGDVHDACCNSEGWRVGGEEATWAATHPIMGFLTGSALDAENQADIFRVVAARIDAGNSAVFSKACPAKWTQGGANCVTGDL